MERSGSLGTEEPWTISQIFHDRSKLYLVSATIFLGLSVKAAELILCNIIQRIGEQMEYRMEIILMSQNRTACKSISLFEGGSPVPTSGRWLLIDSN